MRRLAWIILCASLAGTPMARAAEPPVQAAAEAPLFVELVINGRPTGELTALRQPADSLFVDRQALRAAGVDVPGDGEVDLAHTPGLTARYDSALLRLEVTADPALLPLQRIDHGRRLRAKPTAGFGALVNYDLYALAGDAPSTSLWSEQRVFGPVGVVSNAGVLRSNVARGAGHYLRYDTYARRIDEERAVAYTAGDLVTQSLTWSRSVRMGGVQIARAFRVRPDLVTIPLPSFAGQTAVPSTVDLFVNGYRQGGMEVAPGRFVLDSVPVVTGAGQATIVTTDAVGRQVETTIPFYVSPELLRPGLADFALEAGWLRRRYGLASFDYGPPVASGSLRYGVSQTLTLETHAEAGGGLRLLGAGFAWSPRRLGTFTGSLAMSRTGADEGAQWAVGYAYSAPRFGLAYQHEERQAGFRDLGDLGFGPPPSGRRLDRFIGRADLGGQGSLAVAYIAGQVLDGPRTWIATATYQRAIGKRATLLVTVDHDVERQATGGQIRLSVPLGRNAVAGGVSRVDGRTLADAQFSRAMPAAGGVGVDAALASDQRGAAYGQGSVTWRNRLAELQAGGAFAAGRRSSWFGATGAVVAMNGGVFTVNRVGDAFAVVETGMPDVGVFYENQRVGRTGAGGRLLVPRVTSYQPAAFAIDTVSLPENYVAGQVNAQVAVREGAGVVIALPVKAVRSVMVVLVDGRGAPLAPGGRVERPGAPATDIGWDGLVYLEDVGDRAALSVTRADGTTCQAVVDIPLGAAPLARIGPAPCV